ncbi:MAG: hypothetical protein QW416_08785 [Candidatus Nitrosocaldaceae archaeon]
MIAGMSNNVNTGTNTHIDILNKIESLIKESVDNIIVWDEKSKDIKGKYFYIRTNSMQVGILLGFIINERPIKCIVLCFTDPKGRIDRGIAKKAENLFNSITRYNMLYGFKLIKDDLPALIKVAEVNDTNDVMGFFRSSLRDLLNVLRGIEKI